VLFKINFINVHLIDNDCYTQKHTLCRSEETFILDFTLAVFKDFYSIP